MKNWQYYENDIKMHGVDDFTIKKGDIPTCCTEIDCKECKFNDYDCGRERSKFLYQEHRIQLTRLEFELLKYFSKEYKYIGKGEIVAFSNFDDDFLNLENWGKDLFDWMKEEDEFLIRDILDSCEVVEDVSE